MRWLEGLESRRLLAAYTPDVSFGRDGIVPLSTFSGSSPNDPDVTLIRSDARGLMVTRQIGTIDKPYLRLERYTVRGTPDTAFTPRDLPSSDVGLEYPSGDRQGRLMVLRYNFRIRALQVTRYNADGTPDTAFGDRGTATAATLPKAGDDRLADVPFELTVTDAPDGSVYLAGNLTVVKTTDTTYDEYNQRYLFKLKPNGQIDTGFGTRGVLATTVNDYFNFHSSSVQTDRFVFATDAQGRLVAGETLALGRFAFTRYTPAGRVDPTFGKNGTFTYDATGFASDFVGFRATFDAQDRPLLLTRETGPAKLLRLTPNGRPDAAFADNGVFTSRASGAELLAQDDGKTVLQVQGGRTYLIRLQNDGTLDPTFEGNGIAPLVQTDNVADLFYDNPALAARLADGSYLSVLGTRNGNTLQKLTPRVDAVRGTSGRLYLTGEDADDAVTVSRLQNGTTRVVFNGRTQDFAKAINGIAANLGAGDNRLDARVDVAQTVVVGDGRDTITTGDGEDDVRLGGGNDVVATRGGYDTIDFGGGDKQIDAGGGSGTISGGGRRLDREDPDHPTLGRIGITAPGTDGSTKGGWAIDVRGSRVTVGVGGGSAGLRIEAKESILVTALNVRSRLTASLRAKRVTLDSGRATVRADIDARYGSRVDTGPGDDRIFVGRGDDSVFAGGGNDVIYGRGGDDVLYGGDGGDRLVGGSGDDTLFGEAGDDRLYAGDIGVRVAAAANRLDGGPGRDAYQTEGDDDTRTGLERALPAAG